MTSLIIGVTKESKPEVVNKPCLSNFLEVIIDLLGMIRVLL